MDRSTDTRRKLRQEMDLNKNIPQTNDKPSPPIDQPSIGTNKINIL